MCFPPHPLEFQNVIQRRAHERCTSQRIGIVLKGQKRKPHALALVAEFWRQLTVLRGEPSGEGGWVDLPALALICGVVTHASA